MEYKQNSPTKQPTGFREILFDRVVNNTYCSEQIDHDMQNECDSDSDEDCVSPPKLDEPLNFPSRRD